MYLLVKTSRPQISTCFGLEVHSVSTKNWMALTVDLMALTWGSMVLTQLLGLDSGLVGPGSGLDGLDP